ncbi:MAG: helix-turn-helix transcriptional regulator [Nocardioides sp.]|uniref:helix-turn-helix transcriptional regulator n=1 Tax=Nocardioides sp. TaxID=35761 RepID=UPI003F05E3F6
MEVGMERHYREATKDALVTLGAQIAAARRELSWTAAELASRLGVSQGVVRRMESGEPSTKIGTVLEAAVLTGVPLFGEDLTTRALARRDATARLALLPARVRTHTRAADDDF